jgi:hypothetical protein
MRDFFALVLALMIFIIALIVLAPRFMGVNLIGNRDEIQKVGGVEAAQSTTP